jgi:ribosomal protein S18 acetylase RimI-like enzyme
MSSLKYEGFLVTAGLYCLVFKWCLFRRMRQDDIPEILRMSRENMAPVIWSAWGVKWQDETLLDMLKDPESNTEIMEVDGVTTGYFNVEPRGCSLFINSIQVPKGLKRKGYGMRMMQRIEALAIILGMDSVELWVQTTNVGAFDFYRKLGYNFICQRGNNYLMRKTLGSYWGDMHG